MTKRHKWRAVDKPVGARCADCGWHRTDPTGKPQTVTYRYKRGGAKLAARASAPAPQCGESPDHYRRRVPVTVWIQPAEAVDPEFKRMVQAAVYAVAFVKYRDVMKGDAKTAAKWATNMLDYVSDAMEAHAADINEALGK